MSGGDNMRALLAAKAASSRRTNRHNTESAWKLAYKNQLLKLLSDRRTAVHVEMEYDVFVHAAANMPLDNRSTTFDATVVKACRPDIAVGYWILVKSKGKQLVKRFVVAALVELKRSASRRLINARTGRPFGRKGEQAIQSHVLRAQRQCARQALLYLRTPEGQTQTDVMCVAASGRTATTSVLTSRAPPTEIARPSWTLVQNLADYQAEDDDEEFEDDNDSDGEGPDLPLPSAPKGAGLKWQNLMNFHGSRFGRSFTTYLTHFEERLGLRPLPPGVKLHALSGYPARRFLA